MSETIQTAGKQSSFSALFREFQRVQIPIIQRDYAQGRSGQEELRKEFLFALKHALDKNDNDASLPLDLDFVYGSRIGGDEWTEHDGFAPLDGQQRLTTLFLLHWYLAWKEGKSDDFQERFLNDQRSRFSYEVRPSSHDFFNRLALNFPIESSSDVDSLRALIEDKSWFFRSWVQDPTIVSALTMIEEIHDVFAESDGCYQRLIDPEHPRITFQLLELKNFGLSDDLYIKMNARGKPLTPFETFKARLEQHLNELLPSQTRPLHGRELTISEYFSHRMDTAWADLFWAQRNPETNLYDEELMRLIKAVALASLNPDSEGSEQIVRDLRTSKSSLSFSRLLDSGCLNHRMLETLISVLDYWCEIDLNDRAREHTTMLNSRIAFDNATSRELSFPELVKFAAFCAFVRLHQLPLDIVSFDRWLRVISNLVENSNIERPSDFIDALRSLGHLETHADRVLDYLVEGSDVSAFNRQQIREERIKAALMLKGQVWPEQILAAEKHGYFNGQIEFLLKFSGILDNWQAHKLTAWSDDEHTQAQKQFLDYLNKAKAVFDANGLRSYSDNKWERALLALGDYTLSYGMNLSFLQNRTGSNERLPTWKLLLRGHMTDPILEQKRLLVKALFDQIDLQQGVEASLEKVINASSTNEPWRQMLVTTPQMMAYCDQKMIRRMDDESVYLISKLRTSSNHVELWTYHLYHTLLAEMHADGTLTPFEAAYISVNTDDLVPSINLNWSHGPVVISIEFTDGKYYIALWLNEVESQQFLSEQMEKSFEIEKQDEWLSLKASSDKVKAIIGEIVRMARVYEVKVSISKQLSTNNVHSSE